MTLPADLRETVRRLTHAARQADDTDVADSYRDRRDRLLADYGYAARVRADGTGDTLVCYPQEWLTNGTVDTEAIEDTDRAVELRLSGVGDPDDWETVAAHNDQVAQTVKRRYGQPHGKTAKALAAFASNHYAKPISALTDTELAEFKTEYFIRNAWPSTAQRAAVDESLQYTQEVAAELNV